MTTVGYVVNIQGVDRNWVAGWHGQLCVACAGLAATPAGNAERALLPFGLEKKERRKEGHNNRKGLFFVGVVSLCGSSSVPVGWESSPSQWLAGGLSGVYAPRGSAKAFC